MLWISLGTIVGLALLIYSLMDTTKRADQGARRTEREINPFAEVTITRWPA